MAGSSRLRIVFVIEGGRSRADVAAISAVAAAVERAGAAVRVVRHGLGRVSARSVRRVIVEETPQVVVTTGATSTRDAEGLRRSRGFALVCYYWPAGPIEDIHQRPRHRHKAPKARRSMRVSAPTHAVLGSELHRRALHGYLGGAAADVEAHVLPPLLESAAFAEAGAGAANREQPLIGVYGGHGRELPSGAGYRLVDLDAEPAALLTSTESFRSELVRLRECDAVLVCGCGTADEREAPRRCATALLLGKPVLATGFGESGDGLPLALADVPLDAQGALRAATQDELPAALSRLAGELRGRKEHPPIGLRDALSPQRVLEQHAALLLGIATEREPRVKKTNVATRLLARLRTLLQRQPRN